MFGPFTRETGRLQRVLVSSVSMSIQGIFHSITSVSAAARIHQLLTFCNALWPRNVISLRNLNANIILLFYKNLCAALNKRRRNFLIKILMRMNKSNSDYTNTETHAHADNEWEKYGKTTTTTTT